MATSNVGNLNVKLTLSADQFAAALQTAGGQVNVFARGVQMQAQQVQTASTGINKFSGLTSSLGPIMTSAAFGAQDFASQLGTRGLGAALQAASNNIQVMGAAFGPWGLAVSSATGLAVSGIGAYLDYQSRMRAETKATSKVVGDEWKTIASDLEEQANRIALAAAQARAELQFDVTNKFGGASSKELQDSIKPLEKQQQAALSLRAELLKQFDTAVTKQFGDIFLGEKPSKFLGVTGSKDITGQVRKLQQLGFTVPSDLIKTSGIIRRQLLDIEAEFSTRAEEINARRASIPAAQQRELRQAQGEARNQASIEAWQRLEQEQQFFDQQLQTPAQQIEAARKRIDDAFATGIIDEAQRSFLQTQQDQASREAKQKALEDTRRGRAPSATQVERDSGKVEENTGKTATEAVKQTRELKDLNRNIGQLAVGQVPI